MPLSDKERMQIHDVVDKVVEARLLEFSEIQLTVLSEMLYKMTDKYVESLMQLCKMLGLSDKAAQKESERAADLMLQGFKR